ncbi:MAG TPA: DNA translocase FtsK [Gemmatimonadaceae bacterium]|nr:DNA translocase FtsK [Gemmatimonadaceae bacterium]
MSSTGSSHLRRELQGIVLLLLAVLLATVLAAVALAQLRAGVDVRGAVGPVGDVVGGKLSRFLGWSGVLLLPVLPAVHALRLFGRLESETDRSWLIFVGGLALLLPMVAGLLAGVRLGSDNHPAAGLWGGFLASYAYAWLGSVGAWILAALALSALTAATLAWNPLRVVIGHRAAAAPDATPEPAEQADESTGATRRRRRRSEEPEKDLALALEPPPEEMPAIEAESAGVEEALEGERGRRARKKSKAEVAAAREEEIVAEIEAARTPDVVGDELPLSELLTPAPTRSVEASRRELDQQGAKLIDALRTFRVEGELVGRTTGPTVTQFEIEPAPGVKVRQFANLANDLALAMRAASIRIVAPIPGRGAVGVEVPNPTPEMVAFREIIETREFQQARAALPIALGKDLEGKAVVADLAKMPHLLIAGATGSGKSVCVNTIITSLVYRHTPRTLRFLMVDPKMVELSVYNTLPHLRHKVITDNRDAAAVLKWAVMEMNERYEILAANGCRNIQDFNRRVQDGAPLKTPKRGDLAFEDTVYRGGILPYIVVVIDEMADLMMTVQGEVETPIAMLAQKARAIGIHLILATQRPSVNVITGLIKANFPSRIAFRVASQVDSRTIIDGAGAEMLLGNGDMLFIPPGKSEAARLQGAYLSSEDTERLLGWYVARAEARRAALAEQGLVLEEAAQAEPDILETVRAREAELASQDGDRGGSSEPGARDDLFREAAEVVVQNQSGSTSLLQRRLNIGYGRAARIIDQLVDAGVLETKGTTKGRDVLVGLEELDRICGPRA